MKSDLIKKLRVWEKDDKAEKRENMVVHNLSRLGILNSRLDMLLGSAITCFIFAVCFLFLHAAGIV